MIFLSATALLSIVFLFVAAAGIINFNNEIEKKQTESVKQAIEQSVALCYALEGSYPPDLSYLENNYGLILNEDKYIYDYEIFGTNVNPIIYVEKKSH